MADYREQSTDAAVKLSGIAALTTDASLVAALSPNSPLPAGGNTIGAVNMLDADAVATGTITVTDSVVAAPAGAGAFVSGTSTAGSYIAIAAPGGDSAWNVQITGLTSGALYFEGSLDSTNGIDGQWINVNGRQTGVVNTVLASNSTTNGMYRGNTSGIKYFRVRSVGTLVGTPAIVIRLSGGVGAIFLNASIPAGTNAIGSTSKSAPLKATYSASVNNLAPALTPSDIFTITGSASKTIKIHSIQIDATATAAAVIAVFLVKRSTANTVGTSTAPTVVPLDSTSAAGTATVRAYTANPTVGTLVGNIRSEKLLVSTTTSAGETLLINFGNILGSPIVLRGIAEVLAFNLNAVTLVGGSVNCFVEWTEE